MNKMQKYKREKQQEAMTEKIKNSSHVIRVELMNDQRLLTFFEETNRYDCTFKPLVFADKLEVFNYLIENMSGNECFLLWAIGGVVMQWRIDYSNEKGFFKSLFDFEIDVDMVVYNPESKLIISIVDEENKFLVFSKHLFSE